MVVLHKAQADVRTKGRQQRCLLSSHWQLDSSLGAWLCLASLGGWAIGRRWTIGKVNNVYVKVRKLSCGSGELLK